MIGCLRTRICKQPIIALYFESEIVLKFYNREARLCNYESLDGKNGNKSFYIFNIHVLADLKKVTIHIYIYYSPTVL